MLERNLFLRPIAHRGLHDAAAGLIENTAPAFRAAIARGYGIECDLRPASDGTPFVFHDFTLDRLIEGTGPVEACSPQQLAGLRYRGRDLAMLSYAEFLELVSGKVPLLVEIKSEWVRPDPRFVRSIADLSLRYRGPLALMSFDPAVMAAVRALAPAIPRGIVAGNHQAHRWWGDRLDDARAYALTHLLESRPAAPSFYAYAVDDLPTPVTRFVREVLEVPLFAWTVRSAEQLARAAAWADAPIFEGIDPRPAAQDPVLRPGRQN
jgi:glycerophosphoryl diester phosphodiesterase